MLVIKGGEREKCHGRVENIKRQRSGQQTKKKKRTKVACKREGKEREAAV